MSFRFHFHRNRIEGGFKKKTKKSLPTFEFETGSFPLTASRGNFEGEGGILAVLCSLVFSFIGIGWQINLFSFDEI